jgi:hypothetical protein
MRKPIAGHNALPVGSSTGGGQPSPGGSHNTESVLRPPRCLSVGADAREAHVSLNPSVKPSSRVRFNSITSPGNGPGSLT